MAVNKKHVLDPQGLQNLVGKIAAPDTYVAEIVWNEAIETPIYLPAEGNAQTDLSGNGSISSANNQFTVVYKRGNTVITEQKFLEHIHGAIVKCGQFIFTLDTVYSGGQFFETQIPTSYMFVCNQGILSKRTAPICLYDPNSDFPTDSIVSAMFDENDNSYNDILYAVCMSSMGDGGSMAWTIGRLKTGRDILCGVSVCLQDLIPEDGEELTEKTWTIQRKISDAANTDYTHDWHWTGQDEDDPYYTQAWARGGCYAIWRSLRPQSYGDPSFVNSNSTVNDSQYYPAIGYYLGSVGQTSPFDNLKYVVDHSQDSLFEIHRSNIYTGVINSDTDNCRDVYTCRFSEYVPNIQYRPGGGHTYAHILRDAKWIYRATLPEKNIAIEATIILVNNYDGDTVTSQDWSIEVKRHILSNVQPINADYNRAEVGDVVARNTAGEKVIVRKADISSMDTTELTPIGIVAIPSSHNIYGNGAAMAIAYSNGSITGNELDFSGVQESILSTNHIYNTPSDMMYPYSADGSKNSAYFVEGQVFADIDGYYNTYKTCEDVFSAFGEMWKNLSNTEVENFVGQPGYRYLKAFANAMYIPSVGEIGYVNANLAAMRESYATLADTYNVANLPGLNLPAREDMILTSSYSKSSQDTYTNIPFVMTVDPDKEYDKVTPSDSELIANGVDVYFVFRV